MEEKLGADEAASVQRVLVVDDHRTFTELLVLALDGLPDIECVGQAHDGRSAHVAAPIGRHARRCVREISKERGPAAVTARRVGVDRREPVPPAPLDSAAARSAAATGGQSCSQRE